MSKIKQSINKLLVGAITSIAFLIIRLTPVLAVTGEPNAQPLIDEIKKYGGIGMAVIGAIVVVGVAYSIITSAAKHMWFAEGDDKMSGSEFLKSLRTTIIVGIIAGLAGVIGLVFGLN